MGHRASQAGPGDGFQVTDYLLPMCLTAGQHTLKIAIDYTNAINESNESDNTYTKTITIVAPATTPIDVGDTVATAAILGTLTAGSPASWTEQIGDGSYGSKDVNIYRFTVAQTGTVTLDVNARAAVRR